MNDVIPPVFKLIQEFWIPQEKTKHENLFPQNYISFVYVMEGHKVISFTIVIETFNILSSPFMIV